MFRLEIPLEVGSPPSWGSAGAPRSAEGVPSLSHASSPPTSAGRPAGRARLPPELAGALREAARIADYDQLDALLHAMPPDHAALGEALRRLLEGYEYEEISHLLELDAGG